MKYICIVPDGAADYPLDILGNKTPLAAAEKPAIDALAKKGILGRVKTVPSGFVPSSDVANLSLLGYEPEKYYCGRGPLEAANMGVMLNEADVAFRCNLITEAAGELLDYSAGHITDKEAALLIQDINKYLGNSQVSFYAGKSYRHLMVYRDSSALGLAKLTCFAPHDIMNKQIKKYFPQGRNNTLLIDLMRHSQEILRDHEVNTVRADLGENPANMIWLWGGGKKPQIPLFKEKFGLDGAVVSAVDLIKGIGKIIGLTVLDVKGANGYYDTNYAGKAQAALTALRERDFVFIHIEATDEAGHNQDVRMKIACLERIDKLVVRPIVAAMCDEEFRIIIVPDHPTPLSLRTHTDDPVPFVMYGNGISAGNFSAYNELEAESSDLYFENGSTLMKFFLGR